MDEVTQQNSALVEENAAAAKSLEQQSQGMDERVSFFQVDDAGAGGPPREAAMQTHRSNADAGKQQGAPALKRPAAAPAVHRPGGGRVQGALAVKDDPDWKEF
jgi:methyl-accepting chemotaxis protein